VCYRRVSVPLTCQHAAYQILDKNTDNAYRWELNRERFTQVPDRNANSFAFGSRYQPGTGRNRAASAVETWVNRFELT
jgi:hypothetical protein